MGFQDDPRLMEAKTISVADLIDRLGVTRLKPMGNELIGPCPLCGGKDRFGINLRTSKFLCHTCDFRGGDQIALTKGVLNCDFKAALQFLCGDKPAALDPKEMERRRKRAEESKRKQEALERKFRAKAIADARIIWKNGRPGRLGVVPTYLKARGISPDLLPGIPESLRFIVDHPYVKKIGGRFETLHRGPCMIAGIQNQRGQITAVHQTWIDSNPPHGKAKITCNGEDYPSKTVRGRAKGCAIRLHTPERFDTLVMGEGIETTLSALIAQPYANAAYWAGIDLGKMAGIMKKVEGKRHSGLPDMSDHDAFVPPPWIKRLVFIMDGDSEPKMTRAKLECGLRRAMALIPDLRGQIVPAGAGVDLNDVLVGATGKSAEATNE